MLSEKKAEQTADEPYEVVSIRGSLELVTKQIEDGYFSSVKNVKRLVEEIEKAHSLGVDLSPIKGLDERIKKLLEDAPLAAVKNIPKGKS